LHNIAIQWRLPEPELYDEIDEKLPRINVDAAMGMKFAGSLIHTFKIIGYYR